MDVLEFLGLPLEAKQSVTRLDFSSTNLAALDIGTLIHFINAIADCTNLKSIDLRNSHLNNITERHFLKLCRSLSLSKKLVSVRLEGNHLEEATLNYPSLWIAANTGCYPMAKALVKLGSKIDAHENLGPDLTPPLWIAAKENHIDIVLFFLNHGAIVDKTGGNIMYDPCTPLWTAARKGRLEIVLCLIKYGANVSAKTDNNISALHISLENGNVDVALSLLEYGAGLFNALKTNPRLRPLLNHALNLSIPDDNSIQILFPWNGQWITKLSELEKLPLKEKLKLIATISPAQKSLLLPGVAVILQSAALETKALRYFTALEEATPLHHDKDIPAELIQPDNSHFMVGFNIYRHHCIDVRALIAAAITNTDKLLSIKTEDGSLPATLEYTPPDETSTERSTKRQKCE